MGKRAKIWNDKNRINYKRYHNINIDELELKAIQQRALDRFYREQKAKSLKERLRKFIVRNFFKQKRRGIWNMLRKCV